MAAQHRTRRVSLVGALALVASLGLTPTAVASPTAAPPPAAVGSTSSISGRVTDAVTGAPVGGACVTATVPESSDAPPEVTVCTDATGDYLLDGLVDGKPYTIIVRKPDSTYLREYYGGDHGENWLSVPFPADGHAVGIDIALDRGGRITGTVTSADGTPLAGIWVIVEGSTSDGYAADYMITDAGGHYSIVGLAGAELWLQADDPTGPYLRARYAAPDGSPLVVDVDQTRTGVDFVLARGATVSGIAVDASGTPIAGACVVLEDTEGWWMSNSICTDASGAFRTTGADSGTYRVRFFSDRMSFPTQYYPGVYDVTSAEVFPLAPPDNLDLGAVTLMAGGAISGTITLAGGGSLVGTCVSAAPVGDPWSSSGACVGSDGTFTLTGLAPGAYAVTATGPSGQDYLDAAYTDPATGSADVTVTEGGTTSGIDLTLALGGSIRGLVTTDSGTPIDGAFVQVYIPLPAGQWGWPTLAGSGTTDATGAYVVNALPAGSYVLSASAGRKVGEVYREATSFLDATTVPVSAGTSTSGIDFTLSTAHDLYATATTGTQTLSGIEVTVYPSNGSPPVLVGTTDASGTLAADITPAGLYKVGCHDPQGRYADAFYWAAADLAQATEIYLGNGSQYHVACLFTSPVEKASISGTVTDALTQAPVGGVLVQAVTSGNAVASTTTAHDGTYTLPNLTPGSYQVQFSHPTGWYVTQWYLNSPVGAPAVVTVPPAQSGIDVALTPVLGSVSGTVTDAATGGALSGVTVRAVSSDGSVAGSATTSADGTYALSGLRPGTVTVDFTDPSGRYLGQWYAGASSPASATALTMPVDVTAIDAALTARRSLAGTVTDTATGGPVEGIRVTLSAGGTTAATTTTAADGSYRFVAPAVGSYVVAFDDPLARGYLPEFYANSFTPAGATPVVIGSDTKATGVDAALDRPGSITGTAIAGGGPKERACVTVWSAEGVPAAPTVCVASGAAYSVTGLLPGTYRVSLTGPAKQTSWYRDAASYATATPLVVASGQTVSGIDLTTRGKAKG